MQSVSRLSRWLAGAARATPPPNDGPGGEDWALWRAACEGHAGSARQVVSMLSPQALGLAMQLLRQPEDAEDAVQESFLRLWRSAPSDNRGARLSTYFNTIVLNRCRSVLVARRELAVEPEALEALADLHDVERGGQPVDSDVSFGLSLPATQRRLQAALLRLPVRQRMAVAMWAYADASVAEIARTLELDANAAHQLLHRAKAALRTHLEGGAS
jgi:RNA polymerase sigma-70 factor (ECF subfamily)